MRLKGKDIDASDCNRAAYASSQQIPRNLPATPQGLMASRLHFVRTTAPGSIMSSHDINPEWKLIAIGRGSFATVSVLLGRSVAVMLSDRTPELKHSAAYMIPATLIHSSRFYVHSLTMTQQFPQALYPQTAHPSRRVGPEPVL
jgi:hypothetical protein